VNRRLKSIAATLSSVLLTLFGLTILTFLIGRVMPVDPVIAAVGDNAPEDVIMRARAEMGLDQPLPIQFLHYLNQLLHGDLGVSVLTKNPVAQDIARFFPATFELATAALILAVVIGVPLGVWAASARARLPIRRSVSSASPAIRCRCSCCR
jgi:peptide/nickel transport system permease protein